MQHGLVNRICSLVGENTSAQEAHKFGDLIDSTAFHYVVVNLDVLAEKLPEERLEISA